MIRGDATHPLRGILRIPAETRDRRHAELGREVLLIDGQHGSQALRGRIALAFLQIQPRQVEQRRRVAGFCLEDLLVLGPGTVGPAGGRIRCGRKIALRGAAARRGCERIGLGRGLGGLALAQECGDQQ